MFNLCFVDLSRHSFDCHIHVSGLPVSFVDNTKCSFSQLVSKLQVGEFDFPKSGRNFWQGSIQVFCFGGEDVESDSGWGLQA